MKTHYTPQELEGLPGLQISERRIRAKADRGNWQSRPTKKKDGSDSKFKEYSFSSLPAETQMYLLNQMKVQLESSLPAPVTPTSRESALVAVTKPTPPKLASLKQGQIACMDARTGLMNFIERSAANVTKTIDYLVKGSHAGTLQPELQALVPLANAKPGKTGTRKLSTRSLWKWWGEYQAADGNCTALAPLSSDKKLEPLWAPALMICWKKPQKPKLTEVMEDLKNKIPAGLTMPTYDQARRYLLSLGALEVNRGRMTGNALATLKPYRRRLTEYMYPGDCYTADGHTYDAEVAHPFHGRPFRPEVTPVIDVATRKIIGWSCDLAESGLAVLDALRAACEDFGPCVIFYTDNGSGFKNQLMTAPGTGILSRLDIQPEYSRPRNPQAHGISERAHQTVMIKSARELCTYIGKDMDGDAKQLVFKKTRKDMQAGEKTGVLIEWEEFIEHVNRAIEAYNNRPHTGLDAYRDPATRKRVYLSPNQAWEMGIQRMRKELPQDEWLCPANELPDLYHPAEERTVDRCTVRLGTNKLGRPQLYYCPELVNWHGERVVVAYSPADPTQVWVRDLAHGRLIGVATLNGNADPYFANSKLEVGRVKRGKGRMKRITHKLEEIELELRGKQGITISPEAAATREAFQIELVAPLALPAPSAARAVFSLPATQRGKYHYWGTLDARISAGEEVTDDEKRFHAGYQTTAAWKSERMLDPELIPLQAAQ
jgi:putative transposase